MSDLVGNPEDRFSHNEAHIFFSVSIFIRSGSDQFGSYHNGFPSELTAQFERTYDSDAPSCFFTNVTYDEFATSLLSESFFEAVPFLPSNVFTEENRHVSSSFPNTNFAIMLHV